MALLVTQALLDQLVTLVRMVPRGLVAQQAQQVIQVQLVEPAILVLMV